MIFAARQFYLLTFLPDLVPSYSYHPILTISQSNNLYFSQSFESISCVKIEDVLVMLQKHVLKSASFHLLPEHIKYLRERLNQIAKSEHRSKRDLTAGSEGQPITDISYARFRKNIPNGSKHNLREWVCAICVLINTVDLCSCMLLYKLIFIRSTLTCKYSIASGRVLESPTDSRLHKQRRRKKSFSLYLILCICCCYRNFNVGPAFDQSVVCSHF